MNTNTSASPSRPSLRPFVAAALLAAMTAGCSAMPGRGAGVALSRRDEPSVVLCLSQRTSGGGLRLVGRVETGTFPILGAQVEYRTADPSDPPPAATEGGEFELTGARTQKVDVRKGAEDVSFSIDPEAARRLGDKVIWYRWTIRYGRGGGERASRTAIHRTSLEEAGVPRDPSQPGPDSSVAPLARR